MSQSLRTSTRNWRTDSGPTIGEGVRPGDGAPGCRAIRSPRRRFLPALRPGRRRTAADWKNTPAGGFDFEGGGRADGYRCRRAAGCSRMTRLHSTFTQIGLPEIPPAKAVSRCSPGLKTGGRSVTSSVTGASGVSPAKAKAAGAERRERFEAEPSHGILGGLQQKAREIDGGLSAGAGAALGAALPAAGPRS